MYSFDTKCETINIPGVRVVLAVKVIDRQSEERSSVRRSRRISERNRVSIDDNSLDPVGDRERGVLAVEVEYV